MNERHSPLSVMAGNKPTGLVAFLATSKARGVYTLNNRLDIPGVETALRFQDDVWGRLPDACATQGYWLHHDPIEVARYELANVKPASHPGGWKEKTKLIPHVGHLTWLQIQSLSPIQTYASWYNESVIGEGSDRWQRADWWNDLAVEGIRLMVESGLRPCIGGFATGEPQLDTLPNFLPMLRAIKNANGVLDVHEYGTNGYLVLPPTDRSGAFHYRAIHNAVPADAQCNMILSECGAFGGYTNDGVDKQLQDMSAFGKEVAKDWPWLRWVSWFQLDQGAESCIPLNALEQYAAIAATVSQEDIVTPDPVVSYVVTVHLLPPGTTKSQAQYVGDSAFDLKQSVVYSADDAKRLVASGLPGSEVIVWNPKQWTDHNIAEYLDVSIEIRHFPGSDKVLNVTYTNQLDGVDANYAPGDCGPADVAMALAFYGKPLTVDQVGVATGLGSGFTSTSWSSLDKAAKVFDYTVGHGINCLFENIQSEIDAGRPVIALINYAQLPTRNRRQPNYFGGHYLLIVGYSDTEIIYHDPNWHGQDGANRRMTWQEFDVAWSTPCASFSYLRQLGKVLEYDVPIPPFATFKVGLHMAARGGDQTTADWAAFNTAKMQAIKFLSNHALSDIVKGIQRVGANNVYFRMYADPNDANAMKSGTAFYEVHRGWLSQLNALEVTKVEVGNEPNLGIEGLGRYWHNAVEFASWYRQCATLIRQSYPTMKLMWPGLSPQANVPEYIAQLKILINEGLVDLIGAHSYFDEIDDMYSSNGGQFYRKFLGLNRPVVITESSSHSTKTNKAAKGIQYVQYLKTIAEGVEAILFFVSSTGDPAFESESWVGSEIPAIVGGRKIAP